MGIDVAWNCAISLRPLHEGEETDRHRMISSYADWDVNARLPHGVDQVKRHLVDVDNVPLLVHLFTDVTRKTTAEMVRFILVMILKIQDSSFSDSSCLKIYSLVFSRNTTRLFLY